MTNLDSLLKSRDIILPTKVHLVKAMVFPVVIWIYSWTIKKPEHNGRGYAGSVGTSASSADAQGPCEGSTSGDVKVDHF